MKNSLTKWARNGLIIALLLVTTLGGFATGQIERDERTPAPIGDAKYVFLFIGDGMGIPQISAAEAYIQSQESSDVGIKKLSFSDFPAQGLTTTHAQDRFITGSAAAATAIACGRKTTIGTIAMDSGHTRNFETIADMAKAEGMKVGIVSSVDIDHATPACFYAHTPSRSNYYDIGLQMANSDFDYFGGGRVRLSKTPDGKKTVPEIMEEKGWIVADTRHEFNMLRPTSKQVYTYDYGFASDALEYEIDRGPDDVSLAEFTAKGIELLDNPDGFFMMVEGGKIDWACHANDAISSIYDTIAFDKAVMEAVRFYNKHPNETLIIVTGDHECGGLTLGFAGTGYETAFDILSEQTLSYEAFNKYVFGPFKENNTLADVDYESLLPAVEEHFGLTDLSDYEKELITNAFVRSMTGKKERSSNDETALLYGGYEPLTVTLTHILNRRAGLSWTTYSHTGVPVPTFAMGVGADAFNGYYDNTDIFYKTVAAMGIATTSKVALR